MLNKIIDYSLKNRLMILVGSVLLLIGGTYITTRMDVDIFPELTAPTVVVMTEAHGMAPEEVEQLVTFPIETAVNGATDIRRVRSSSSMGFSIVWVEFDWGTDIYNARQTVTERLVRAGDDLPRGVGEPVIAPQSSLLGEVMIVGLTSDHKSPMELRTMAEWNIRPRLLSVGGVAQVTIIGGDFKEYQILVHPERLKHYQVSFQELIGSVKGMNINSPGGFIHEYGNRYIIRGLGRSNQAEEIGNSVIKMAGGFPVKVSDVAEVKAGAAPKIGDGSYNGRDAVLMTVNKQPNVNTIKLNERINTALDDIQHNVGDQVQFHTDIFNQARFIETSIHNVQKALIEGSVLVVIILMVFLMNYRTTLISLVAIPLSLLVSIVALDLMGFTINTMSLGGMAIAIGSLVDDAIIDVENVYKRLRQNVGCDAAHKEKPLQVVFRASQEIRPSIMNATLIIIVAFVPLFFLEGMEGRMLRPLGISFIVALFASLVVALTVTPVMCSYLLTDEKRLAKHKQGSWLERRLRKIYYGALTRVMKVKYGVLGFAGILLVLAILLFTQFGMNFLPPFNEGSLTVNISAMPGISLAESNKLGRRAEQLLLEIPEIDRLSRKTGRAELAEHSFGVHVSELDVPFTLKDRSRPDFLKEVRHKLNTLEGVNVEVGQPITHRMDHMLSGTRANIAIKLFGTELNQMYRVARRIESEIRDVKGIGDLSVEQQVEIPQIKIRPDRDMLAKYGIPVSQFVEFVDHAFAGEKVSDVFEEEKAFDLVVRYDDSHRGRIEAIREAMLETHDGRNIPLYYVADIESSSGPNTINRESVNRKLVVSVNVASRDVGSVVDDIRSRINRHVEIPENYHVEYGGQFESAERASRRLSITSVAAILVIFLILFQEFHSTRMAGVVLLNLPLALIGGVLAIWFTSGDMSIPAIIGFITLFGIATRNGILLVSRYDNLRSKGVGLYQSVMRGSLDRLNPILMTALTAALALIPLAAAGNQAGNEIQSPMAVVILGGLLTSTFLNMFIIPVVYYLIHLKAQRHDQ